MAETDFQTHDEYLATQSEEVRSILERVRQLIREAVPEPRERISYQIPVIEYLGHPVFFFSGFAKHWSLSVPPDFSTLDDFADRLAPRKRSKSAVQFPLDEPLPEELLTEMVEHQVRLIDERGPKQGARQGGR